MSYCKASFIKVAIRVPLRVETRVALRVPLRALLSDLNGFRMVRKELLSSARICIIRI